MKPSPIKPVARRLRRHSTEVEKKLWQRLRNRQLEGFKFRRQWPIGPYVPDFVCFEARLIRTGWRTAYSGKRYGSHGYSRNGGVAGASVLE